MRYEPYKLEQWVETFDPKYGRPIQAYEEIADIEACINTSKVYKTVGNEIYTITQPTAIIPERLPLEFTGKYRIVSDEHTFEVVKFQLSNRFTVFDIKEVS